MGTWGTAIFSDDLASDLRAQFRELIGDGCTPEEATKKLLKDYSSSIEDEDESATFWIALAAVQSKCGRLLADVKSKAIQVIDAGSDLFRWDEAPVKLRNARRAALSKLRNELEAPSRPPTKIRRVFHDRTDWEVGYAIGYRLLSGNWCVLRVIGIIEEIKSRIPIVELCDWIGNELPAQDELQKLPFRHTKFYNDRRRCGDEFGWVDEHDHKFTVYALGPRDLPSTRVQLLATGLDVNETDCIGATYFGGWKHLDDYLQRCFEFA